MSSFSNYKKFAFQIKDIDPNTFGIKIIQRKNKQLHNFMVNSIDRKDNASTLRQIITLWNIDNLKYKPLVWETSVISKRITVDLKLRYHS